MLLLLVSDLITQNGRQRVGMGTFHGLANLVAERDLTDDELQEAAKNVDIDGSGDVSFEEFVFWAKGVEFKVA